MPRSRSPPTAAPELTSRRANGSVSASARTLSRKVRLIALLGAMKSVERVVFSRFSSAAWMRSCVVAVEQALRRQPAQHQIELPGEVVGILNAAVAAARAERRHLVRGIAGEDHATVPELFQPPATGSGRG